MGDNTQRYQYVSLVHFGIFVVVSYIVYIFTTTLIFKSDSQLASVIAILLSFFCSLLSVGVLTPFIIVKILKAKPITNIATLNIINKIFTNANITPPKIYSINLGNNYNALIAGFSIPISFLQRSLFITENLIANLREEELDAVIKHEISHIQLFHLRRRISLTFFATICITAIYIVAFYISAILAPPQLLPLFALLLIVILFKLEMKLLASQIYHQEIEADTNAVYNLKSELNNYNRTLFKLASLAGLDPNFAHPQHKTNPSVAHPSMAQRVSAIKDNLEFLRRNPMKISSISSYNFIQNLKPLLPIHTIGIATLLTLISYFYLDQINPTNQLFSAFKKQNISEIEVLLAAGIKIDSKNYLAFGMTALNQAILDRDHQRFDLILSYGASLETPSGIFHSPPWITALYVDDIYFVDRIYDKLVTQSYFDKNKYLEIAKKIGKKSVIAYLENKIESKRAVASESN